MPEREPPGARACRPGYREVLDWRIRDKRWQVIVINLLALLSLPVWLLLFGWFGVAIADMPLSGDLDLAGFGLLIVAVLLMLVLHELLHGVAMRAAGARPRFGIMWKQAMVYATAPGHAFPRQVYLAIGLAPLVGISLVALLGMLLLAGTPGALLLAFLAAGNAASSSGDLWIVAVVLRFPAAACVIDERDGIRILLPPEEDEPSEEPAPPAP